MLTGFAFPMRTSLVSLQWQKPSCSVLLHSFPPSPSLSSGRLPVDHHPRFLWHCRQRWRTSIVRMQISQEVFYVLDKLRGLQNRGRVSHHLFPLEDRMLLSQGVCSLSLLSLRTSAWERFWKCQILQDLQLLSSSWRPLLLRLLAGFQ